MSESIIEPGSATRRAAEGSVAFAKAGIDPEPADALNCVDSKEA